MPGFDVLAKDLNCKRKCFLEASAGTGKTFAIEHLVVRLLLEKEGPKIDEILIVTFTKAATLELKARIRKKIEQLADALEKREALYPYLEPLFEESDVEIHSSKKRLQRALSHFDDAKIFTIHSFCFHALQENPIASDFALTIDQESQQPQFHEMLLKDHFRASKALHPQQWDILLRSHRGDLNDLIRSISTLIEKRTPIECGRGFHEIGEAFFKQIEGIEASKEEIFEALLQAAPSFEKMCDRQKKIKNEIVSDFCKFSSLFEGAREFPFRTALLSMRKEKLLKSAKPPSHPLWQAIDEQLIPLIEEATNHEKILALIAERSREKITTSCGEKDLYFYEDLLIAMKERLRNPQLASLLRSQFKAVFIDEFQDTDRNQWEIFTDLFITSLFDGALYLIGDPKQSIYRFRHADLYTYMEARKKFAADERKSLLVNFRAQPGLCHALNTLCTSLPDFLYLPKTNEKEACPEVFHDPKKEKKVWRDDFESIHFFRGGDEEELYLFVINEIKKLHLLEKIPLKGFAVLVKDRFQAASFCELAKKKKLPVVSKRTRSLEDSKAFDVLENLIHVAIDPKDQAKVFSLYTGPLFYATETEHQNLSIDLFSFKKILEEKGLFALLEEVINKERLFAYEGGIELYGDLLQIAELIVQDVAQEAHSLRCYLSLLRDCKAKASALEARGFEESDAVQVLTIHVSKGLEYEVVFPIGLIKSVSPKKELVPDPERGILTYRKEAFERHLEELEAEKMRLFYVAITRAKERLYLPVLVKSKSGNSPMELFLEKLLGMSSLENFIAKSTNLSLSNCSFEEVECEFRNEPIPTVKTGSENLPSFSNSYIYSFSSLANPKMQTKTLPNLPSGKEFGNFLHSIMETIPFKNHEAKLDEMIARSSYSQWKEEITLMVSNALHLPLQNFALKDLDPNSLWKELEFFYPDCNGNYVKGFIDLVFEYGGKVYFLDYKSNILEASVEEEMHHGDYFLQAEIYRTALEKYLDLFERKKSYGGCFYLFLRGPIAYYVSA